ncbi:hypothetical protein ATO11_16685 [Pseudaestuariivita atlantica]|uniref:Uncharacterized protein n=2 Tax=Pseudaestuariivita atlantica TaxID=1317121 RepID=A0A0L1JLM5_9RHOB|nr:hypothetical protein ATO11_16685 [Pseudaestuariivita atlantica]
MTRRPAALIPRLGALLVGCAIATPAAAQVPHGCFSRTYDNAHLAANPAQIVRDLMRFVRNAPEQDVVWADPAVTFADQGRVRCRLNRVDAQTCEAMR